MGVHTHPRHPRRAVALLALVLVAGGCSLGGSDGSNGHGEDAQGRRAALPPPPPSGPITVTRDDRSLPRGCGAREVARALQRFVDAFNRGDQARLQALVAPVGRFQWYSVGASGPHRSRGVTATGSASSLAGAPTSAAADERPRLFPQFAASHRRREHLRILEMSVSYIRPRSWFAELDEPVGGFDYMFEYRAADLSRFGGGNRVGGGKGGIACRDKKLLALTGGVDTRRKYPGARACPRPRGERPKHAVVVCTAP